MNDYKDIEKALLDDIGFNNNEWDIYLVLGEEGKALDNLTATNRNKGIRIVITLSPGTNAVLKAKHGPMEFSNDFAAKFYDIAKTLQDSREAEKRTRLCDKAAADLRNLLSIPDSTSGNKK